MEKSMATSMTSPPGLPILPTVRVAYTLVFMHWRAALKISWAWLVILAVVSFMIFMAFTTLGRADFVPVFLLIVILLSIHLFGMSSIAVAWHRLILLREAPAMFNIRVDGPVPRYAWLLHYRPRQLIDLYSWGKWSRAPRATLGVYLRPRC